MVWDDRLQARLVMASQRWFGLVWAGGDKILDWGSGSAWCCIKNRLWLSHGFALRWLVFGFGVLLLVMRCMACMLRRIRLRVCRLCLFQLGGLVLLLCFVCTNGMLVGRAAVLLVLVGRSVCRVRCVGVSFSRAFGLG
jgi:hypothetical protein